ncbi:MAG TPA: hypothetical protein VFJ16_04685 [Longimicrobium sp.]|nr:hypothetical protein [Longimicrobium sp.]
MRRLIPLLLLLPLAAGCTYHRTVYSPLRPEDSPNGQVLHRFTMIRARTVYPFHDHEWDLNLLVPEAQVREGAELRFPGDAAQAVFSEWHQNRRRVVAVPTGTLRFVEVRTDAVKAQVNMRADVPGGWSVNRVVWFRYHPLAATEMPWIRSDTIVRNER